MREVSCDDWPVGSLVTVPHAWRGDTLWHNIQEETRGQIRAQLRATYAELLHTPLPPTLTQLVSVIEAHVGTAHLHEAIVGANPCTLP